MYVGEILPSLKEKLYQLSKKDRVLYERAMKKIEEIILSESVDHYKNLRNDFSDCKRVHIGHFVLVFSYEVSLNKIVFVDFDHHDFIYES